MNGKRALSLSGLAALALVSFFWQPAQVAASSANEITIDNFSFAPATTTVKVGTAITWVNRDDIPHTVVSDDGAFKSKALDTW